MRILHLDAGRQLRGGQWQVLRLLEGLRAASVECTLLARTGSPLCEAARTRGIDVEPLSFTRLLRRARGFDLIHAHDAHSHTLAALIGRRPLVVSRRVAFAIGSRWKYARAVRYLAVSEYVAHILTAGGVPKEKIHIVHDGVPLLPPSHGAEVLAPAYRDDPRKGASLAADAARLAGVPLRQSHDLERDLPTAGLFVYITHAEGLGSGVLMAMSAGVPVIASNVGGLREIIRHRENGLLVANDAKAIAAAIRELSSDSAMARRIGAAARHTIEERFTVETMVRETINVYREVLA